MIARDREAFADYLESLGPDDWETESLCIGWTVKGVTTHLLVTPTMSKGQVFFSFLKAGFNLDKMSAKLIDKMTAELSTDEIVARTSASASSTKAPPGLKPLGVLGEVLIHTADISLAVDKPFDLPVDHYVAGLDYMKDVQPVLGCKKRIEGLKLSATDSEWSTGDGPPVEGPSKLLLLAMAGRKPVLEELAGEGVDAMRDR
ncbi:MAG: maleylpyruvate isomerase family mycothiol-dependent enzyme [Actinobacteria bacterium]|nr:maleylpyruvate isomerase family mycothiol-dependent enzyme [Actinomycetota bacterium]